MKKRKNKQNNKTSKEQINLNEEIIIGLTPKKESNTKSKKANTKKKRKTSANKNKTTKNKNVSKKNKKKNSKILKWLFLFILIILAITLFLLSPLFNIKEIKVTNNNKVSNEEVIKLSELKTEENIFKTSNKKINNRLKTNPYIESVKIKRNLNGVLELNVKERVTTFMLQYADTYAYINNQGFILEISNEPANVPIITGILTKEENIKPGNRLENADLQKLDSIIKIMATAKSRQIDTLITSIDISDPNNYIILMAEELKTVHFGKETSINDKMSWILEIIEQKKGIEGEIFVMNPEEKVYFREKV